MSSRRLARFGSAFLGTLLLIPGVLSAQSILGTRGLGLPLEPMNARARALGSVGVGLLGGNLNPMELASSTSLLIPTVNFTLQPHWGSGSLDGESLDSQGMRFPLIGLAYPVSELNGMVTLTFGTFMDQRWKIQEQDTEVLDGVPTPVTNTFKSEGGIAALKLGWAQRLGPSLSVAVSAGFHTGSVTRTYIRTFDSLAAVTPEMVAFTDGGKWQYGGPTAGVGAVWDPSDFLRFGGSITWSGELDADPSDETKGERASYAIPTVFRLGASGVLTPRLSMTLGMSFADWTSTEDGLEPGTVAGGVWSVGGGLEWEGSSFGSRTLPIRLGVRRSDLPFLFGGDQPTETVLTGGFGLNLTQAEQFVLAGVDLAVERGRRKAGALSEEFWRGSVTFRVSGW
jgi:hypothetical protein